MKPSIRARLKSRMGSAVVVAPPDKVPVKLPPKIGLALGGGGARGLAHILMLEVFDELGIKPSFIVGTSIGAVYGAAYASGLSAKYIRAHTEDVLSQRLGLVRQLVGARAQPIARLFSILPVRAGMLDPVAVLDVVLPPRMAVDFDRLSIPLAVVATDFHSQEAVLLSHGRLKTAVAASMALPALFAPVIREGRTFLDGGLVNPLPFDLLTREADITVAIDVSGGAREESNGGPGALGALLASTQIMQRSIVREKLKSVQPDVYIDSTVEHFHMVEFHKFREILKSAAPAKEALKRQLDRVMTAQTVRPSAPLAREVEPEQVGKEPRSLLRRRRRTPTK